jgi:cell division protein FtsL
VKGFSRHSVVIGILAITVIASAITTIYARHESRRQFALLQQLTADRDELGVEWGRLQIEQSAWSAHSRVEEMARKKIGMRMPVTGEIEVVRQ